MHTRAKFAVSGLIFVFIIFGLYLHHLGVLSQNSNHCGLPSGVFSAWTRGVVTEVEPVIKRNCIKLFSGDANEVELARTHNRQWKNSLTDEELLKLTGNCSWVEDYFQDNLYTTRLERSFPVAYSFVVYDSPQQVVRLLRLLYRPTNTYCLHLDRKSNGSFRGIVNNIAHCLENVVIPSKLVSVSWGHYSLMEAQMACLEELTLLRTRQSWRKKWTHVINLCGKELPIASTHQIVSTLRKFAGSSVIKSRRVCDNEPEVTRRLGGQAVPFNLTLYKSMTYMALSYEFANFLRTDKVAIEVYKFFKTCKIPEEHFYPTMFMIPETPGGFKPNLKYVDISNYFWRTKRTAESWPTKCTGKTVHNICIVTSGELREILERSKNGTGALFHNKYFMEDDHTIMDCMEERLVGMNREEYLDDCR